MAVYLMGIIEEITDPATFQAYVEQVGPVVAQYGGSYLFVSPQVEAIEGPPAPAVVAALSFADAGARRAFWDSPEYDAVKGLRHRSTRSRVLFADAP